MLSKISNKIKSLAKKVSSFFNRGNQTATVFKAPLLPGKTIQGGKVVQSMTPMPTMSTKYGPAVGYDGGAAVLNSSGQTTRVISSGGKSTQLPVSAQPAAPRTLSAGGKSKSSGGSGGGTVDSTFYSPVSTRTISSSTVGGTSFAGSGVSSGGSLQLPSAPTPRDVGAITLAGLTDSNTQRDESGQIIPKEEEDSDFARQVKEALEIPQRESVLDNREVRRQQEVVRERQQEVGNYQNQLNAIVAKQQQDLLRLREIGSQEGVTEAVYGGQQAVINREAAIKALPIQAQLASAQGNLELAQDYLKDLTNMIQEDLDNDYEFKMNQYKALDGKLTKKENEIKEAREKADTRAYNEAKTNTADMDQWMRTALSEENNSAVRQISQLDPTDPDFRAKLNNIVGGLQAKTTGSDGLTPTLTYEQWKNTPEAQAIIAEEQNNRNQTLLPTEREEILREAYNKTVTYGVSKYGKISSTDEAKGLNYLFTNGGTQADIEKFQTDRGFQAWVLNQI